MNFDKKAFFKEVRPLFGGFTSAHGAMQIEGLDFLIDYWLNGNWSQRISIPQFAYVLATVAHETAFTMHPIAEYGHGRGHSYGVPDGKTGKIYYGRGYPQLTWKFNYEKATKRLRELGLIGSEVDFVQNPELVMEPKYAAPILFIGMDEGWFTGKSLDSTIDDKIDGDEHGDFVRARKIINGTDKAEAIARYGDIFLKGLVEATK